MALASLRYNLHVFRPAFGAVAFSTVFHTSTPSTRIWSKACEKQVNQQIKAELEAQYAYIAMANYFERDNVALMNIAKFFRTSAEEESKHAQEFITYQNKRGGTVEFFSLTPYNIPEDFSTIQAFKKALSLEEFVYEVLLKTHDTGFNDPELQDLIASTYLREQVDSIYELKSYIANLTLVKPGLGEYMFDKEFTNK